MKNTPPSAQTEKIRVCVNCEKETDSTPCPYCGCGVFKRQSILSEMEKGRV